jgi:hypothetical protein
MTPEVARHLGAGHGDAGTDYDRIRWVVDRLAT